MVQCQVINGATIMLWKDIWLHHSLDLQLPVTTQDFINFWGKIFVFILLVLIENSQGFKTF
jgi:hypothetical protein